MMTTGLFNSTIVAEAFCDIHMSDTAALAISNLHLLLVGEQFSLEGIQPIAHLTISEHLKVLIIFFTLIVVVVGI